MPGPRKRVVVVEDDESLRLAMDRVLSAAGFTSITYPSGEAALRARPGAGIDCMVLDIHLPGISGLELFARMAARGDVPPVIFITAYDDPAIRSKAAAIGTAAYLVKPFLGTTLVDAVARAVARPT